MTLKRNVREVPHNVDDPQMREFLNQLRDRAINSSSSGATGPAGPPGPKGDTGATGATGPPGSTTLAGCTDVAIAAPTSGQVLTYDTTSSKWKNAAATGGAGAGGGVGSLVLLESHTASGSAELDFTSWYSPNYEEYLLEFIDLLPVNDNVECYIQCSVNGGSSYDTTVGNYETGRSYFGLSGTASGSDQTGSTAGIAIWRVDMSNASPVGASGSYKLMNPGSSSKHKLMFGEVSGVSSSGTSYLIKVGGRYKVNTAVNALRIIMSSGNIASGTVRIYGVSKLTGGNLPSWLSNSPDYPPTSANALDDEFNGTSLDPKWSWNNQGLATATLANGHVMLKAPAAASGNIRIIEQSCPAAPWKFRAKLSEALVNRSNFAVNGMCIRNATNGKLITNHLGFNSWFKNEYARYNSVTSFNAAPFGADMAMQCGPVYFEIENDGTNLFFRISKSGVAFFQIGSELISNFIGSVDKIGLFADSVNSVDCIGIWDWFRRIS